MSKKNKNVLFLVTGMTPAIITETIWALACDPELDESERWLPDEVQVLSTKHGINQIRSRILQSGVFEQFKADYPQLKNIQFDSTHLHSIKDTTGNALHDLRTPEDNEYAANEINKHIRNLTSDKNISLHVSIAGGRKTMGFYAGYALSLHGRANDEMSHVLVDAQFENNPNFYYPTNYENYITNNKGEDIDTQEAHVWLAKIPFVRMKDMIKKGHKVTKKSFSEVVKQINDANQEFELVIHISKREIYLNGIDIKANLPAQEFSFLCMFAKNKLAGLAGFMAPKGDLATPNLPQTEYQYIATLTKEFIAIYSNFRDDFYLDEREMEMGKSFFNSIKSKLKKELEKQIGPELTAKLMPIQDGRGKPFYLAFPEDKLVLLD